MTEQEYPFIFASSLGKPLSIKIAPEILLAVKPGENNTYIATGDNGEKYVLTKIGNDWDIQLVNESEG